MMPKLKRAAVVSCCVGIAGVAFVGGRAWGAGGIPAAGALNYSGLLQDAAGAPLSGTQYVEVKFWNDAAASDAANLLCDTGTPSLTPLTNGRFTTGLPDKCTTQVGTNSGIWAEVLVGPSAAATASLGRAKIGAVPFAVEANHAVEAGHAASADGATTAATASAAGGALKTTIDGLAAASTKVSVNGITPFAIPAQTFVKVPYLTEAVDDTNEFNVGTSVFTAAQTGDYQICASLSTAGSAELDLFVNNVRERAFAAITGVGTGCRITRLTAGQTADVRVFAGPAVGTISSDANWDWLTITRLR